MHSAVTHSAPAIPVLQSVVLPQVHSPLPLQVRPTLQETPEAFGVSVEQVPLVQMPGV